MAYEIASLDNSGGVLAHYKMLAAIKALAEANGWVTLRYDTVSANRELILQGEGLSGTEEIFVGFRCYQDVPNDYYNITFGTFTGYVSGNTFQTQPGARLSGVPAHNSLIKYFMVCNAQRIAVCMRVGTPVYEHGYVGKMFPYARPSEFPFPIINCGMLVGEAATRFSEVTHAFGYRGTRANFALRKPSGTWGEVDVHPWYNTYIAGGFYQVQPSDAGYFLVPITPGDSAPNVYGVLDGIWQVTGFNNAVENVVQVGGSYTVDPTGKTVDAVVNEVVVTAGGRAFVVLQDVSRTGFNDFIAMEMN